MGSIEGIGTEQDFDVEETVFVAVGKNVEESKNTLLWVAKSFAGKKICVLHVHRPENVVELNEEFTANEKKQHAVEAFRGIEKQKVHALLNQCLIILAQAGAYKVWIEMDNIEIGIVEIIELSNNFYNPYLYIVHLNPYKVWIEMDNIEIGIVEIIAQLNIRWLVMGAAADKYYSKKLAELKSKKATFVCHQAPISCHIWFICEGYLIYTRGGREDESELENAPPLLNPDTETKQSEQLMSESFAHREGYPDGEDEEIETDRMLRSSSSQCSAHSTWSPNTVVGISNSIPLLTYKDEETQEQANGKIYCKLEEAIMDAKNSKQKVIQDSVKRWKEEDDTLEAKCKAKALENLCVKELTKRKEMEENLERLKQEVETMKNQHNELQKELRVVQDQNSELESQLAESHCMEKELEEKIISAVGLLITFKERRDKMRIEHGNAVKKVQGLKKLIKVESQSFCFSQILAFSFLEINQATNNFDPSWKIGEGRYGSVYKGFLRHVHVAIKMLPSYGPEGHLEFQQEVEVLSRVRHPNLVTLIGTCPESRSLVHEYLKNGSLEDRLACKDSTPPLPWQTRTHIASDICSVLIFLHSNEPGIVHGNLKPSKILLDANFVSKLGDLGTSHLVPKDETPNKMTTLCNISNPNVTSTYLDPEYLENGKLTPESDVYSFGIILLQLLTGRPVLGIVKDVQCALEEEKFNSVLDFSAGDWPLEQAERLAHLALRCCEKNQLNRPDLASEILSVVEPMRASCRASTSCLGFKELRVPSHFLCPILQEVMKDPQIAADGFTYEAEAIKGWLKSGHNTSPMTNLKLGNCTLLPNYALHNAIQEWEQNL